MKALITVSAIALLALAGNGYWLNQARIKAQLLDACAKANNVYACHMVPQPTEAPRVEYRQAAILPPPVM
jgi:hypothetical protein